MTGTYICTGTGAPADGTLTFDEKGMATIALKDQQSIVLSELPTGTKYAITESDYTAHGYNTTAVNATGTIAKQDKPNQAAVFTNTRNAGALKVQKLLHGNAADAAKKFTFTIQLSRSDGMPVDREYACEGGVYSTLTFANGAATVELAGNETVTIKDILA
ncbi:MAG: DUF5979 domain-containing protein, partial [Clostridia bacterium]